VHDPDRARAHLPRARPALACRLPVRLLGFRASTKEPAMRTASRLARLAALAIAVVAAAPAQAKKKAPPRKPVEATAQTARAISELAGRFKWGMSSGEAMKIVADDLTARYEERLKKEADPFKQDVVRKEMNEAQKKLRESYVKFDGQKTGWDVSLLDHEFAHKNDESMFVIWEKDQRRFLFFFQNRLWKQFIAFDAAHPAFAGKTFDDFADLIQKRYGPAAMTFRKLRTSDDQTLDHLEWAPAGDYVLWAIDHTTFYGNYCLALIQKSVMAEVDRGRKENSPQRGGGAGLVDQVTRSEKVHGDENADIVDEICGRTDAPSQAPGAAAEEPHPAKGKHGGKPAGEPTRERDSVDPLDGTNF
jgi:uncharacterized protein YoaH (UPF0181 family)